MTSFQLICTKCGSSAELTDWSCRSCESPLKIVGKKVFNRRWINEARSLWRYSKMLAYVGKEPITLGEGFTPMVKVDDSLLLKLDYLNPTGSFKDRGSTLVLTTHLGLAGRNIRVHEDSSGNAGASMAAYCARAGIPVTIYVPSTAGGRKMEQICSYGAKLVLVRGPRDKAAKMAQGARGAYLGHTWNPFFVEGMKTLAYEIWEQSNRQTPETIYFPSSSGTILLGLLYGLQEMLDSGAIQDMPKLVAVQPKRVSPLFHLFNGLPYNLPKNSRSVADAITSHSPPRLEEMARELRRSGGRSIVLEEEEILNYTKDLAHRGFHVEPSAALSYGGYMKEKEMGRARETSLAILTGLGLKVGSFPSRRTMHNFPNR